MNGNLKAVRNTSETYSDFLYANPIGTRQNNCYAYAINSYKDSGDEKLQPGDLAGMSGGVDLTDCKDLVKRALADAKAMGWNLRYLGKDKKECCPKSTRIVAVLAPNSDFHWYRFHRDLLYRVKTPRTRRQMATEFGVSTANVQIPGPDISRAVPGDLVLIRNANVWSHKQGHSGDGPLLKDACGKIIKNPAKACRNYGNGLNYKVVCGSFCLTK